MKNLGKYVFSLVMFLFVATQCTFGQTHTDTVFSKQIVVVKMKNGTEYTGTIKSKTTNNLVLMTENGELNLIAGNVKSINANSYKGKYRFSNSHETRYFFGPTAIPIKKFHGYYQNVLVSTNFVNVGITNHVSVGGGFELISTLLGYPIWFFTPKIAYDITPKLHAGGGVIMAGFAGEASASLGYGVFTYGTSETNVTFGAGLGYIDRTFSQAPAIMISGTHRLTSALAILSENYIIPSANTSYFGVQGLRIMSPKNAFDVGLFVSPALIDFIPALPFVGYARSF
ncbi:MAG: hypothetical protein RL138_911 [Bacteroidota bacterium]|jgi:hypothetical protein